MSRTNNSSNNNNSNYNSNCSRCRAKNSDNLDRNDTRRQMTKLQQIEKIITNDNFFVGQRTFHSLIQVYRHLLMSSLKEQIVSLQHRYCNIDDTLTTVLMLMKKIYKWKIRIFVKRNTWLSTNTKTSIWRSKVAERNQKAQICYIFEIYMTSY